MELALPEPVQAVVAAAGPTGRSEVELKKVFQTSEGPLYRILAAIKEAVGGDSGLLVTTFRSSLKVIGLEYLLEVREEGYRSNPAVICLLCSKETQANSARGHVLSATHRLTYLECFFPIVRYGFRLQISRTDSSSLSQGDCLPRYRISPSGRSQLMSSLRWSCARLKPSWADSSTGR